MSAPFAVPFAFRHWLAGAKSAWLRRILDAAVHLSGFSEPRADRLPTALTVRLGAPGDEAVTVIDRREDEARTYRFEAGAGDLSERIAAVADGRGGLRAKVLLDPAACFIRCLDVPSAALPRMRALLAEELEARTPFRSGGVYNDWFVEGEDIDACILRIRHVVIKKERLDPPLEAMSRAGLHISSVTVGGSEDQTMPVDLLSQGHRSLPALFPGARTGDVVLLAGAALFLVLAFTGWRMHQDATLAGLDEAFAATRRIAGPPIPAPVQDGLRAIRDTRAPSLERTWNALAAALPESVSATALHVDRAETFVTLSVRSELEAMAALARLPGYGPPVLRSVESEAGGGHRLIVLLPILPMGGQP